MRLIKIRYLLTIFLTTFIFADITYANIDENIENISQKLLKKFRENDEEFSDYEEIENLTNEGDLPKLREKIKEFKGKYILSSYQNILPLLELYCTYKIGEKDNDSKNSLGIDEFKMSEDAKAYLYYMFSINALEKSKDYNFLKDLFGKNLSAPEYGINPTHDINSANFCKEILNNYKQIALSYDVEKRLFEIERLIVSYLLECSLNNYKKGRYISAIQNATNLISTYPHRRESIQALFMIYLSYIKLHIYDLAEPFKDMYILNRHHMIPLYNNHNLNTWFSIAKDYSFTYPDAIDEEGYKLTTKLANILNRLDNNFQDDKNYNTKFELLTKEQKKSKVLKVIKDSIIRWISLKRRAEDLDNINNTNILEKLNEEYNNLYDFGEELTELGYETLLKIDFKVKSNEFSNSLDLIEKSLDEEKLDNKTADNSDNIGKGSIINETEVKVTN